MLRCSLTYIVLAPRLCPGSLARNHCITAVLSLSLIEPHSLNHIRDEPYDSARSPQSDSPPPQSDSPPPQSDSPQISSAHLLARSRRSSLACLEPHTRTHAWEPHTLEHSPIEGTRLLAQGTRSSQLSHILQNAHESPHRKRDRAVSFVLQAAAGERIQSGPGETTQVNASRVEAAIIPPPSAGSYHICRTSRYIVVPAANLVSYQ